MVFTEFSLLGVRDGIPLCSWGTLGTCPLPGSLPGTVIAGIQSHFYLQSRLKEVGMCDLVDMEKTNRGVNKNWETSVPLSARGMYLS